MSPAAAEQRLAEGVVAEMLSTDAFSRWMGVEVRHVGVGRATIAMTVRPEMANGFGVCHGGVTYAFADSALAFACNGHGTVTMAVSNSIGYPVAVQVGDRLVATAAEESVQGPLGFYTVTVAREDGTAVAHFRGTVYRTKRAHAVAAGAPAGG